MTDLNRLPIDADGGLVDRLGRLPDVRKRRGKRHTLRSILAVAVCGVLSGADSFVALGEWGAQLPQELLERLGCRWHPEHRCRIAPSERTLRRTLQGIDVERLDRTVSEWLEEQADGEAIAIDGKTLRGSRSKNSKGVHLVAALVHREGVVVNQKAVPSSTNEISVFKPVLAPLDLRGKVVTADAMHTQNEHAEWLKQRKKADFVFILKDNQPSCRAAVAELPSSAFSPCGHCAISGTWAHGDSDH